MIKFKEKNECLDLEIHLNTDPEKAREGRYRASFSTYLLDNWTEKKIRHFPDYQTAMNWIEKESEKIASRLKLLMNVYWSIVVEQLGLTLAPEDIEKANARVRLYHHNKPC